MAFIGGFLGGYDWATVGSLPFSPWATEYTTSWRKKTDTYAHGLARG
jgi:hypothetical protein